MLQRNTKCMDTDTFKSGAYDDFVHFKNIRVSVFIFVQKKGSLLFAQAVRSGDSADTLNHN